MTTTMTMAPTDTPDQHPIEEAIRKIAKLVSGYPKDDRDLFQRMFMMAITVDEKEEREEALRTMFEIIRDNDAEDGSIAMLVLPKFDEERKPSDTRLRGWTDHVAGRIKKLREEKGWTQADLAERSGLTQSHICRIENGVHSPSHKTITKIAAAFGLSNGDIDPVD